MDLQIFCRSDMDKLNKPFRMGAFVYASDGKIAVRVPAESMPDVQENPDAPNAASLEFDGGADFIPLPACASSPVPCIECGGTGIQTKCRKCAGTGEITCVCGDCGHEHETECPSCEGSGTTDGTPDGRCAVCGGTKEVYDREVGTWAGNRFIADWLLAKLGTLDDVMIASAGSPLSPAQFLFKGGVGIVMPMSATR